MQLGVVTTSYPRFPGDPAGNFVAAHVAALRALGHRVEVIAAGGAAGGEPRDATRGGVNRPALPGERGRERPLWIDARRVGGLGLFYTGGAPDALERSPLRAGLAAAAFTARLTAQVAAAARRWDAIVAHWLAPSAIAALPAGRPLTAIGHGGDVFTLRRLHLLGPVLGALHRRGARLVLVSEQLREVARAAAPALAGWLDAALVQPMGVDAARFAALPRAPSDPPTVLCVARLVPIKGVDVALAAMRHVRTAARLVIAGDGPERARLARAAAPATALDATLLGEVPTDRRDDLLSAASVVVVPSRVTPGGRTEGTPAIALEALAAGVPVVASAVGGLRGLAGRAGVQLVPPDDPRALAGAIDRALADPLPPAALRAAVADLDWRQVAPRLLRA
ncbi:MAG TPA: glycosyltransferase family 4 protein [Kofleriaceae bacterium]|jgi:glycosyltransferase involved in cell wall biosynthesis|nr:glycosyltransferase family 4 protein [Kofleriaceae bacterium]